MCEVGKTNISPLQRVKAFLGTSSIPGCNNQLQVITFDPTGTPIYTKIAKESELHHSIGSLIDGAHPGPKTDRDYLGRYCPKTFETANGKKVVPPGIEPRASGLSRQCSATKLRHPARRAYSV